MDIRITDHGNIWVDGKQYIGLDRMNQLLQEKGAIDYDRIQSIVYDQLVKALGVPEITEEQVRAFCEGRNWTIYDKALLDDRLASQYRLGYNEGVKDADERFEALKVKFNEDLRALRAANSRLKVDFANEIFEGLIKWIQENKIGYMSDDFALVKTGIDAARAVIQSLLTPNEIRSLFGLPAIPSPEAQGDKPAGDGCGFVD
jgi:hypothetical protein